MKLMLIAFLAAVAFIAGCSAPSAEHVVTKTVSFTGSVAKKTTVTAVKTSVHVTASTTKAVVHGGGSIAKTVVQTPMVIFKDTVTGVTKQIPYSDGLRLYAASQTAQFQMGFKSFELIRNGTPVMTSMWSKVKAGTVSDPVLHAGDVIQIASARRSP